MHDVIIGSAKQECVKKRVKYVVYFTFEPGIRLRIIQTGTSQLVPHTNSYQCNKSTRTRRQKIQDMCFIGCKEAKWLWGVGK